MPTKAHLIAYCTSPHFSSCDHFQRLAPQPEPPPLDTPVTNRRRSIRVPQHSIFRFSVIGGQEHPAIKRQEESYTLDISRQGLCFTSRRRITPDTVVLFSVEEENEFGLGKGQGRVVWSRGLGNTGLFGCGVEILG
ncbi:PilZ domain-containing protein [Desulfobulbus rhabdoformis]|nr:PilZ domain-containing protein [Desulfobulbus rhabdoformis]